MTPKNQRKEVPGSPLAGKRIAVPESRQLDVLSALFERRGATVLRVPLVSIQDAPNQQLIIDWIRGFIRLPPDLFLILTGEGLRRLINSAARQSLDSEFIETLSSVATLCRGPKPARVLRELKLTGTAFAQEPTTEGVIKSLQEMDLQGKRVAAQLYGDDPNIQLQDYLKSRDLWEYLPVSPYVYAPDSHQDEVRDLINALADKQIDLLAFTSKSQLKRLTKVAQSLNIESALDCGMRNTRIAAIGPIVADALSEIGYEVSIMPQSSYFMKPLVRAAEQMFAQNPDKLC